MMEKLQKRMMDLCLEMNAIEKEKKEAEGCTFHDFYTFKERTKFVALDVMQGSSTSEAWLIEKETGEIYNIKGYGVPDRNKKLKADIGNVYAVDAKFLISKHWNYLR